MILIQFSAVQRCADKRAFAGGVGQDAGFVSGIGGGGASDWACGGRDICTELYVAAHQVVHALIIHDEHHEVGALAADLRTPADSADFERSGSAPLVGGILAGGDALAVLAANDKSSFHQLGNYGYALGSL